MKTKNLQRNDFRTDGVFLFLEHPTLKTEKIVNKAKRQP